MKILIAGATGAMGRPLVRMLVQRGHDVVGLTRTAEKRSLLESMGAGASVGDALDAERINKVVADVAPTHLVHLLTALPPAGPLRARDLRATNALRIQGTANLVRAAIGAGVKRLVAESFIGVYGAANFDRPHGEDGPLPPPPDGPFHDTVLALRSMEDQLAQARDAKDLETVTLRFGGIYGPDVPSSSALLRLLRAGRVFLPRGANGVMSFIHVDDAAEATIAALEHPAPAAVYNIVDDEPMPIAKLIELTASTFGTPPPRTAPAWLIRLIAPIMAAAASSRVPLSNANAKRELGWHPRYPNTREGLRSMASQIGHAA